MISNDKLVTRFHHLSQKMFHPKNQMVGCHHNMQKNWLNAEIRQIRKNKALAACLQQTELVAKVEKQYANYIAIFSYTKMPYMLPSQKLDLYLQNWSCPILNISITDWWSTINQIWILKVIVEKYVFTSIQFFKICWKLDHRVTPSAGIRSWCPNSCMGEWKRSERIPINSINNWLSFLHYQWGDWNNEVAFDWPCNGIQKVSSQQFNIDLVAQNSHYILS